MDDGYREDENCAFSAIFCDVARIQGRVYMAQGIYEEVEFEDINHAFCAVAHESRKCFYLFVIECVSPVLVMHDKTPSECKYLHQKLAEVYVAKKKSLMVYNKEIMRNLYKHKINVM